jgi:hypothetical protein
VNRTITWIALACASLPGGVHVAHADEPAVQTPTPPGTSTVELRHKLVETSPPNTPVDITAITPHDGDLTVTLSYRGSDDTTFTVVPMTWRASEFVGRIPADRVHGNYVQYYLEARNRAGTIVARVGKSTSPNLIKIEGGATSGVGLELDPLTATRRFGETPPEPPPPYAKATLISSGAAAAMIGTTIAMYVLAQRQSDALRADSTSCGTPPCTPFDKSYDHRLETLGERYNTAYQVTLALSVASAGVAGYFWYRRLSTKKAAPTETLSITPVIGDGFTGAATVGRF